eukprot:TRINITY_DN3183_c3_g4_i1.p1 TRINITY_DN3183_c3_g4~~TRINITY_DN3183_c3_g4_i1.p1  ORF type:complete len:117 (+),score=28.65 TRINITY_DN3183_c3_g4_i1:72-422(+)
MLIINCYLEKSHFHPCNQFQFEIESIENTSDDVILTACEVLSNTSPQFDPEQHYFLLEGEILSFDKTPLYEIVSGRDNFIYSLVILPVFQKKIKHSLNSLDNTIPTSYLPKRNVFN